MNIGIGVPVLTNWRGFATSLNTWQSRRHFLSFAVVDNVTTRRSVAASWNLAADILFDKGVAAVLLANDDVLCHPDTIDNLVAHWQETKAWAVTGDNVAGSGISIVDFINAELAPPYESTEQKPDLSFWLLPKRTWLRVGRFDENFYPAYFEDNDYFVRLVLAGGRMLRTTSAPIYHIGGQTQFNPPPDIRQRQKEVVSPKEFERNRELYKAKWNCDSIWDPAEVLRTAWKRPYNDPLLELSSTPLLQSQTQ